MEGIKIISFNLRYDNDSDNENRWELRKNNVAKLIDYYQPDLIGLQECLDSQRRFLSDNLPEYEFIGVGRDDGKTAGEYAPIMFNKNRFVLLESNNFWLSETPEIPGSKSWGTACTRICTYVVLYDNIAKEKVCMFNTHLDHISDEAKHGGTKLILNKIKGYDTLPVILTGDFNSFPDSNIYNEICLKLNDTATEAKRKLAAPFTVHDFNALDYYKLILENKPLKYDTNIIDYIFVSDLFITEKFRTITDNFDGKFPSDHFPIIAEVKYRKALS